MTESDVKKIIRDTIREELCSILMGNVTSNQSQSRVNVQRFATEGEVQGLRSIQPFGLSSRAPAKTPTLVVPIDANASHLVAVGNFDQTKPTGNDGETLLYDQFGHIVYLSQTKMQFGSKASAQNMVLGQIFKTMMSTVLEAIAEHKHIGNLGYFTAVPDNAAVFTGQKSSPVDDSAILSDKCFTEK